MYGQFAHSHSGALGNPPHGCAANLNHKSSIVFGSTGTVVAIGIVVAVGKDSGALQLLGVTVVCVARLGCVAAGDSLCLRFAGDGELSVVQSIKLFWGIVVVQLLDVVLSGALCADEDNF